MQINVAQLLKEPVGSSRYCSIDEFAGENCQNRTIGQVKLIRTNRGILVDGKLATDIYGTCARCLNNVILHVNFDMEDEYFPILDISSGKHLKPEVGELTIDESHILDLSEAIRQYIIMATPTKILCRPDCPGICPTYSHENIQGDCQHSIKAYDRRWEKLVQLEKESIR